MIDKLVHTIGDNVDKSKVDDLLDNVLHKAEQVAQPEIDKVKNESKQEVESMLYVFMAIALAVLFIGLALCALCIYIVNSKRNTTPYEVI